MTRKLIAIVGPTASGKTTLGIELAQRLDGAQTGGGAEIVGADSRQVYRRMDIGTAKPTVEEQAAAPHHLIDIVDPDEQFSLGTWLDLAKGALDDIWSRGKQPILAGGTGQYVWALIEGWRVPRVAPNDALRDELGSRPAEELLAELRRVDPEAESYIDPRNVRRLIRALEVQAETGRAFSFWRTKEPPEFETKIVGLRVGRDELYEHIDGRVDAMVEAGLVDEVRSLLEAGYARELPAMSGIGYAEMCAHIAGEMTLQEAVERTKTGTHRLARHQNAWFKPGDERINWIEAVDGVAAAALEQLEGVRAIGRLR